MGEEDGGLSERRSLDKMNMRGGICAIQRFPKPQLLLTDYDPSPDGPTYVFPTGSG